mmetsp:Transcript_32345/g.39752  ORF Transcript_32345/g.39752 Transcript_32345/m.39752 type:complete len:228 (+) Transcript_32345:124-807(+)|eukprot:CAMPEP_0172497500 /NCGR_PEP_ID=MMETSP1066-20121228/100847_1 /TAXON_ID=671091 /ORGANISM="Coscinodiscus wailesii, Strain CCMP2513" /LENGTH=227 /DNA_ID=CAMNT_0013270315 /DNA_START=116 /DNA_END=799 /DNA_ORIENTATION=-
MAPLLGNSKEDDAKVTIPNEKTIVSLEREMELESQLTEMQRQMYISEVEHSIMTEKIHKIQREKSDIQFKFERLRTCISQIRSAYTKRPGCTSQEPMVPQDDGENNDPDNNKVPGLAENNGIEKKENISCGGIANGSARRLSAIEPHDLCLKSESELDVKVQDQRVSLRKLTEENKVLSIRLKDVKKERDHSLRKLNVLSSTIQQIKSSAKGPSGKRRSLSFRSSKK